MNTYKIEPYAYDSGSLMSEQDIIAINVKRAVDIARALYPYADYCAVIDTDTHEVWFTDEYITGIE